MNNLHINYVTWKEVIQKPGGNILTEVFRITVSRMSDERHVPQCINQINEPTKISLWVEVIYFLPFCERDVMNQIRIVLHPSLQFHLTMKVTMTIMVWCHLSIWFQSNQIDCRFFNHPPAAKVQRIRTDINIAGIKSNTSIWRSGIVIGSSKQTQGKSSIQVEHQKQSVLVPLTPCK